MGSTPTQKQIEAFELTTERLQTFIGANQQILGEVNSSPYGFIIFCSFLVIAAYAPPRLYFPNTLVERNETDTEVFRQIVIRSIIESLLNRHEKALNLRGEEKKKHAVEIEGQVVDLLGKQYTRYYGCLQRDVSKLSGDQGSPYPELSESFLSDVLGLENTSESPLMKFKASLGLFLSTTISGLMGFFEKPENIDAQ
jgi:hypothetical protein